MKCLNMKIADVLFFLANLLTVYSANVPLAAAPSQSTVLLTSGVSGSNFDEDCPEISKMIRDNNLTDYTINCKTSSVGADIVNVENVLRQTCPFVKTILNFICESKTKVNTSLFTQDNSSSLCPFDFSHLQQLGINLNNFSLVKELTDKTNCAKVCSDLHSNKKQCVVLYNVSNYIKRSLAVEKSSAVGADKIPDGLEENKDVIPKIESSVITAHKAKDGQSDKTEEKGDPNKHKNETIPENLDGPDKNVIKVTKEQKTEISSTAKDETLPDKNFVLDEDDLKSSLEGPNEELEDVVPPFRPEVIQAEKISESSFKGKEIYPGEGFFQAEDSHFFFYFIIVSSSIVVGYLAFHNKNKILAYALEGTSGRRSRRRPNPARYRKLETNLEEAMSSCATNSAASSVVY